MSNFYQRLALGSFATFFAILLIWFAPAPNFRPFFALIIASLITLAVSEMYYIAKNKNFNPLVKIGLTGCFLYVLSIFITTQFTDLSSLPYLVLLGTLFASFLYFFKTGKDPLVNLSITLFGLMYIAIPLSIWFNIVYFFPETSSQEGRWWLLYLLAVIKITDMGAYFVGSALGKHKMTPYISPGKTWEGALGGLFLGLTASLVFYIMTPLVPIHLTLFQSIWLGVLLSFMGQIGDLAESLIKRDAGIKNSSHIPGLGGVLDVFDSLVFTSPILYIFIKTQVAS